MKPTLRTGLTHRFAYQVPASKTVPHTYPEAPEIASMPDVFATGFMIALMEWTCMQLLAPHLDAGEGSVGVHVDVSHVAATPVGMTVTVDVECVNRRVAHRLQGQGARWGRSYRRRSSRTLRRGMGQVQGAGRGESREGGPMTLVPS